MLTLFWTADSPFCRITLWSIAILNKDTEFKLQHLTWDELRNISAGGELGIAATVPCLTFPSGQHLSDSLRILAYLLHSNFNTWLLSPEGDAYRMIEGQFSRVLYALYDGVQGNSLEKVHGQWQRALASAERAFTQQTSPTPLAAAALHVLVTFCLVLQPQWQGDLSEPLIEFLMQQESNEAFHKLKSALAATHYRVPCSAWAASAR